MTARIKSDISRKLIVSEVKNMRLNCGDVCPKTGSYKVIYGQGKIVNTIYVGEGETMPPTQYSDCYYEFDN